ncbi:hypothetical protein [Photorhabdus australis]|uniref:hypothetical protein n=1 Tax=Photorhabdus australis TaxID=286156 RepID=UPI000561355A|nr:hypothetical protein [Photorhabdus australis]
MIKNTVVTRDKLMTFIAQQPPSKIVMEACGSANYWSRQFKRFGHEVKQISPQYVAPFRMGSKNDKNDAVAIVEADSRPGMHMALPYPKALTRWSNVCLSIWKTRKMTGPR